MEEEISLRDYIIVLVRKWWLILLVFVATTAGAVVYSIQLPNVYETRTQLLIISRVSERLPNASEVANSVASSLSIGTLKSLAKANDLLADIVRELDLRDPATGRLMAVESLAGMMEATVEGAGRGQNQPLLPLLTMTVRGGDPQQVKEIADKWAQLFIERNAQLFTTEAVRSFEFIRTQYEETQRTLLARKQEKLAYQRQNPLDLLQIQLKVMESKYQDFLAELESKRADLVEARARQESLEQGLEGQSPFLRRERSISEEGVFALLAGRPDPGTLQVLPELRLWDEIQNPLYFSQREQLAQARTATAAISAEIRYLEAKTEELQEEIKKTSEKIAQIQLELSRFDQEIGVLNQNVNLLAKSLQEARMAKEEQAGVIRVVEAAVVPQVPVGPNRRQNVMLAGVLGLFLGVVLAFFVHYLQGPEARREEERKPRAQETP